MNRKQIIADLEKNHDYDQPSSLEHIIDVLVKENQMKSNYRIIKENGEWFVYDPSQDIYVNRNGYVAQDGFFTQEEAEATRANLNKINAEFQN